MVSVDLDAQEISRNHQSINHKPEEYKNYLQTQRLAGQLQRFNDDNLTDSSDDEKN